MITFGYQLELAMNIAACIYLGNVVAVHQGRTEFGPRVLGNINILADPRKSDINESLNKRLNQKEFMPLAPNLTSKGYLIILISPKVNIFTLTSI